MNYPMKRTFKGPKLRRPWPIFLFREKDAWRVAGFARRGGPLHLSSSPRSSVKDLLVVGEYVCLTVAVICLGYVAWNYGRAGIFQAYQSWRFDQTLSQRPPSGPRATAVATGDSALYPPPVGSVLARLNIPRLDLSVMVLEGDDAAELAKGAGHVRNTALPGGPGNVVFAAHRDTFFRPLRKIREGDDITVTTTRGVYHYRVGLIEKVDPDDVRVLKALDHATLTLITCYPFEYIGNAPKRFIVQASEIFSASANPNLALAGMNPTADSSPGVRSASAARPRRKRGASLLHAARQPQPVTANATTPEVAPPAFVAEPLPLAAPLPPMTAFDASTAKAATSDSTNEAAPPDASKSAPSKPRRLLRKVRKLFGSH